MFERFLRHDRAFGVVRVTWVGDLDALLQVLVGFAEVESVHHAAGQQVGVAGVLDLHLAKHASDNDFAVLVVDFHTLAAIDLLDFVQQVLLNGFFPGHTQDVVRNQRTIDQGLTSLHDVAGVNQEVLPVRHQVLTFDP